MLPRITAYCLVALVLAPFTAPFRTCDLAVLIDAHHSARMPMNARGRTSFDADATVASVPAITSIGRARSLQPCGSMSSSERVLQTASTFSDTLRTPRTIAARNIFSTVLQL